MGRNWAISIGVNQYDNLKALQYAKRDAQAIRDFCRQEANFERVYYFSDDSPQIEQDYGPPLRSQPTYGVLSRFLRVRFEQPFLQPGDNLWFFFAGHGRRYQDRDYLMPMDADPGNVEGTAIAIRDVSERLRRCGADNIILLLDACRNEGARDGQGIGIEAQPGVVSIFACSPDESSYEIEELQQGSFTYTLLQGFQIQGEGNCATVERLNQYLRYQVPTLNRHYNKPRQTPYTIAEPLAKQHLILLPKRATLGDVTALKNDALEAEAEQEFELAEHLWIRVLAVSPADRQAIRAIKRIARMSEFAAKSTKNRIEVFPSPSAPPHPTFEFEMITVNAQGQIRQRQNQQAEYRTEVLDQGVSLEVVLIPGDRFQMGASEGEGANSEHPKHLVTVPSFWMGKYPVTQGQWKVVATFPKVQCDLDPYPSKFKGNTRPVDSVTWYDAIEFCRRLSRKTGHKYRLPSEAEWEYACRAGTTTPFHFGETLTPDLANYNGDYSYGFGPKGKYRKWTTPVGGFKLANAFGLYDMHGNVWEWCLDHWHKSYQGAPSDGGEWVTAKRNLPRLLRGGSWNNNPDLCRSASRVRHVPDGCNSNIGLRVVSVSPSTFLGQS